MRGWLTGSAARAWAARAIGSREGLKARVACALAAFAVLSPAFIGARPAAANRRSAGAAAAPAPPPAARTAPLPPAATPSPPPPAAKPVVRYRIAGCRSRGLTAYRHGPPRREVAIGFDDGPAADTGAFVRMLERSRARATFFVIGRQLDAAYRPTLLRALADGDILGDHTFTHPDLAASREARRQLERTIAAIRVLTGYTPCVFRPPYGAYNGSVVRTARALGLATVLWNDDPRDWALPGIYAIARTALAEVQPGSIIISHDGGGPRGQTLAAYPRIIAALRRRGFRIVTIPELLGFRPVYIPCIRLCYGIGVARSAVPRDAIIERAP